MTTTGGPIVMLGFTLQKVYEIAVFQAERHTPESNYRLTLTNFTGVQSTCKGKCGDGVVAPPEMCDLGAAMNTGAWGLQCRLHARALLRRQDSQPARGVRRHGGLRPRLQEDLVK